MKLPSSLRTLATDLVARRLWPLALVLVIALVAVPVVVLGGASEEPASVAASGTDAPAAGEAAAVTMAEDGENAAADGKRRNPFTQPADKQATKPTATSTTKSAAGAPASTPKSGSTGGSGSGSGLGGLGDIGVVPVGGSTGGSSTGASTPASGDRDSWHVDLRFGKDGSSKSKNDVPRLSPLPSQADPFFVFLGVAADGKTAMFLVSSDAVATGDGKCIPSPENCDRVDMQAGETEFFDVATPDGKVDAVPARPRARLAQDAANAAVASAARARESSAGRKVLRAAVDDQAGRRLGPRVLARSSASSSRPAPGPRTARCSAATASTCSSARRASSSSATTSRA